jgi:hypothetical protein
VELLTWLESTGLSTWVRESESLWAYPGMITFHAVGLAIMVGLSAMIDLRLLGVARGVPLAALESLYPAIWVGFWVNAISGGLLILSDPIKMFTNPIFYAKMVVIALAVANVAYIQRRVFRVPAVERGVIPRGAPTLAITSLVLWTVGTVAGRLTAYLGNDVFPL